MLAVVAAEEAVKDAGLKECHMEETGVNVGMGIADLELIYDVGKQIAEGKGRRVTPFFIPRILTNMPAGHVSIKCVHGVIYFSKIERLILNFRVDLQLL